MNLDHEITFLTLIHDMLDSQGSCSKSNVCKIIDYGFYRRYLVTHRLSSHARRVTPHLSVTHESRVTWAVIRSRADRSRSVCKIEIDVRSFSPWLCFRRISRQTRHGVNSLLYGWSSWFMAVLLGGGPSPNRETS